MDEVQKLLGPHIEGLKTEQDKSPVRDWLSRQQQEDLDRLGLGLQAGIPNGYLVLDLKFQGELGCPGAELEGGVGSLSGLSFCRGLLQRSPAPRTRTCVCMDPSSAPSFNTELRLSPLRFLAPTLLWSPILTRSRSPGLLPKFEDP